MHFSKNLIIPCCLLLLLTACEPDEPPPKDLQQLSEEYWEEFEQKVPPFRSSYREHLMAIPGPDSLLIQKIAFRNLYQQLSGIMEDSLSANEVEEYRLLKWSIDCQLERLELEERFWTEQGSRPISKRGLFNVLPKDDWYKWYLKKWLGDHVKPEDLYALGKEQIQQAQRQIRRIQQEMGFADDSSGFYQMLNNDTFFVEDPVMLQRQFEQLKIQVDTQLANAFSDYEIPEIRIAPGDEKEWYSEPVHYREKESTFYYPLPGSAFNRRYLNWAYLHAALPGRHFEAFFDRSAVEERTPFRQKSRFFFPAYTEGWATYAEGLGGELDLYNNLSAELGRWEWDLVRSVRMVLDVGINYLGWTNREALKFWKQEIVNQDQIAMREIRQIREHPGRTQIYKYGAAQLLKLKARILEKEGEPFNQRAFHDRVLAIGAAPFWLVEEILFVEEEEEQQ